MGNHDEILDHHSRTPFENLYSDIHLGLGDHPWLPIAGAEGDPLRSGARGTAWNIRTEAGAVSVDKPSRKARPGPVTRRSRRRAGAFLRGGGETCREPRAADGRLTHP